MRTKIWSILIFIAAITPAIARAQPAPATPNSNAIWEQPNETQATAQALAHRFYLDAATVGGPVLTTKTCVTSVAPVTPLPNVTCTAKLPAMTVGSHTIKITASLAAAGSVESDFSNVVSFTMQIVPSTPTNLRIGKALFGNPVILSGKRNPWKFGKRPRFLGFLIQEGKR